jgi:hypothetical protein
MVRSLTNTLKKVSIMNKIEADIVEITVKFLMNFLIYLLL